MANIRIKDQTTDTALVAGDYVIVDNATEGTRKFDLGQKLADIDDDFTDVRQDLQDIIDGCAGLTAEAKQALLACIAHIGVWSDEHGQDYYDALYNALYPPASLDSITAVYTQTGAVTTSTSLNDLRDDLVVTAHFVDGSSQIVTDYILSGTLTEGTSVITVTYGGKTTTFNVEVGGSDIPSGFEELQYLRQTPRSNTASGVFINTGVSISSINNLMRIEAGVMPTEYNNNDVHLIAASRVNGDISRYGFDLQSTASYAGFALFNGTGTPKITPTDGVIGKYYDLVGTVKSDYATITDGTLSNEVATTARDYSNTPICVGGGLEPGLATATLRWYGRIYYIRLFEGDTALFNYVPCRRKSDGAIGMYDLVSNSFKTYYDATNINISAGPPVTPSVSDINIEYEDYRLYQTTLTGKNYCGVTVKYEMDEPTNLVYPAGILPYGDDSLEGSYLWVYDANGDRITYIYQKSGSSDNRWAQNAQNTLAEFSQSWELKENYSSIAFTVDVRYIDDSYMYDKTTGNIWFAGRNTPYYGMSNISEANV